MTTTSFTREHLLEKAREAEAEERIHLDRLSNIGPRVAEARRAAEGRFYVQNAEKLAGRSTNEPMLDYSEVSSIQDSEAEIKENARQAGIRKLRLYAALHNHEAEQHRATFESLGEPLESLELQKAKIENDYLAVRNARLTAHRKHELAWGEAQSYSRAASYAENASEPIRRL